MKNCRSVYFTALAAVFLAPRLLVAASPIIWSAGSSDLTFTLHSGADPTLPANQDMITANVAITRGQIQGLFNAASESFYTHNLSPADTEWAFSTLGGNPTFDYGAGASAYQTLTFTNWEASLGGSHNLQFNITSFPGVLHLITDNIYIDIEFNTWGGGASGGFSYTRAIAPTVTGPIVAAWNGSNGNWSDPTRWSSNPAYPNNGSPAAATYAAAIPTGTVTLDVNATVSDLRFNGTTNALTATLDLAAKSLIVQADTNKSGILLSLTSLVQYGSTHPAGILSSATTADPTHKTTALVDNALLNLTQFAGQTVNANSLLLESTWLGDSNLDRKVDVTDLGILATNYGQTVPNGLVQGDFNGDGKVDVTDLGLLATNYGAGTTGGPFSITPIPEPTTLLLLSLTVPALLSRRRR